MVVRQNAYALIRQAVIPWFLDRNSFKRIGLDESKWKTTDPAVFQLSLFWLKRKVSIGIIFSFATMKPQPLQLCMVLLAFIVLMQTQSVNRIHFWLRHNETHSIYNYAWFFHLPIAFTARERRSSHTSMQQQQKLLKNDRFPSISHFTWSYAETKMQRSRINHFRAKWKKEENLSPLKHHQINRLTWFSKKKIYVYIVCTEILHDDCVNHTNYRIEFPFYNWKPFHSHITTSTVKNNNTWDREKNRRMCLECDAIEEQWGRMVENERKQIKL